MNSTTVAVDLAKNVFELAVAGADWRIGERCVSAQGTTCFRPAGRARRCRRNQSALMVSINRVVAFGRAV
jgi:hypothetical protein